MPPHDENPYNPLEVYKDTQNDIRSEVAASGKSILRFVPAAILLFVGLQVVAVIAVTTIQWAISPVPRGPQAPPLYLAIIHIGLMFGFGIGWVYAAVAIIRGQYDLALIVFGVSSAAMIISVSIF
jgi:hypothetical protein